MSHRVRWYASQPNEQKFVQVDEGNGWVDYRRSIYYQPDFEYPSGFRTFQNCLKKGYTVEESVKVALINESLGQIDKVSGIIAKVFNMRYPEAQELVEYVAANNGECVVYRGTPEQCEQYVMQAAKHNATCQQEEKYVLKVC